MSAEQKHTPLKPCPFCGGRAEHVERHNPLSKWRHSVDCASTTCGMSGPVEASRAEAIEVWNRRADAASSQERIAQLEGAQTVVRANLVRLAWEENSIMIEGIDAALGAQPLAPEPEGWKLVPVEPTEAMIRATLKAGYATVGATDDEVERLTTQKMAELGQVEFSRAQYAAMLAAAPERIVGAAK